MDFWGSVTALGDSGVLLPVAVIIACWLASARQYRLAWQWCLAVGGVGITVALSKLLFMGWCLGLPELDFTGISGHTAMAAMVLPNLLHLSWQTLDSQAGRSAWRIGAMLAVLVGLSRLAIHVHSVSEVIGGLLVGLTGGRLFLQAAIGAAPVHVKPRLAVLSLALLPGLLWLQPAPTQFLLQQLAILISGQHVAFTRETETCELPMRQIGGHAARPPIAPTAGPSRGVPARLMTL